MSSRESSEAGTVARTGSWDVRRLGSLDPQGVWGPEVRLLELPLQISPLALPGSGLSAYRERESGRAETANQEDLRNACALWPPPRLRDLRRPTEGGHPATPPEFRLADTPTSGAKHLVSHAKISGPNRSGPILKPQVLTPQRQLAGKMPLPPFTFASADSFARYKIMRQRGLIPGAQSADRPFNVRKISAPRTGDFNHAAHPRNLA